MLPVERPARTIMTPTKERRTIAFATLEARRGADARVQVNFRDSGVKWLALEYAKLEAA
jgi:hypothetical protein